MGLPRGASLILHAEPQTAEDLACFCRLLTSQNYSRTQHFSLGRSPTPELIPDPSLYFAAQSSAWVGGGGREGGDIHVVQGAQMHFGKAWASPGVRARASGRCTQTQAAALGARRG